MPGGKWTAERDQRLLMLIAADVKIDYESVAARWAEEYPDDTDRPNGRGIYKHLWEMKKKSPASGASAGTPKAKSTPKSTKRAAPKTPASSNKKARTSRMSDDEDDDEEIKFDTPIIKRDPSSRRSKTPKRSYKEMDEGSGDEFATATNGNADDGSFDENGSGEPQTPSGQRNGAKSNDFDDDEGSDVNYNPLAEKD